MATQTERHKNARQEIVAKNGTKLVIAMKDSCTSGFVSHWCTRATNDLVADVIEATKLPVADASALLAVFLDAVNAKYGSALVSSEYDFQAGKWNRKSSAPVNAQPVKANADALNAVNGYILSQIESGRTEADVKAEFVTAGTSEALMVQLFPDKKLSPLQKLLNKCGY